MITNNERNYILEYSGLSTDTKPTSLESIANGSLFFEIDTGKVYAYDAEGDEWIEEFSFKG